MQNPYASLLGDRNPLDVIGKTAVELKRLADTIGASRAEQAPAPGKWCAREIVTHLADTEIALGFRLRQTLAENNHTVQPFDQDQWAKNYAAYSLADALATFAALRAWDVALIRSVKPQDWEKPLMHPERGPLTFRDLVTLMAGHDLNHLSQLERIAKK